MKAHCELCGNIVGEECDEWEGYTTCCNELVCNGSYNDHVSNCIYSTREEDQ
jgi:hypothetical protein